VALHRVAKGHGKPLLQVRYVNEATLEYNEIRPDNEAVFAEASLVYGLGFLSLDMQDRAEKLLLTVIQVRPDNLDARRGLAAIYYDHGAMTRALGQMEKWSQLDDGDGQPHRFMGIIYKDFESADDSAIQHYEAALQRRLKPSVREEVVLELAEVLARRTQYADALRRLDETEFETEKGRAALPELCAVCLHGLGRSHDAVRILDPLLNEEPPSTRALCLRAKIHSDAGELEAAVPLLRRALEIDPHEAACRYQLAMVYQVLGRGTEAAEQRRLLDETQKLYRTFSKLNEEADKNPTSVEVRQCLADLSKKLGKFDLARMWRRAAQACQLAYQPK
jgi:tetratricopeptide (TPR) repeat protein